MRALLLAALLLPAAAPAAWAETRCGWIVNPTPANWWLEDADGTWLLMTQGAPGVPGMELIPDLTEGDWVRTNGWYGYGCACMEVVRRGDSIARILSFEQIPLRRCLADPALPAPPG